jgi:ABC-type polar amino acid transport system ATPase subunit
VPVLKGIDFGVTPGQLVFMIGASGSGKGTFLRRLNFLEMPSAGTIEFEGAPLCDEAGGGFKILPDARLRKFRAQMPKVFQQFSLFAHKTVLQNLIEGPMTVLDRVKLRERADANTAELSGGQQQHVAIGRALMMKPRMILFDEPTSALDPELAARVLETIRSLEAEGMTMIIVTHELAFARNLADQVHFMVDGLIEESGPADQIFGRPESARLRNFLVWMIK